MASTNTETKTWDSVATSTLEGWLQKDLADQVILSHPTLAWAFGASMPFFKDHVRPSDVTPGLQEEKSAVRRVEGVQINVPLRKSRLNNIKWIGRTERMPTTAPDPFTTAVFTWSILGAPLTVSVIDVAQNKGAQMINYLEALANTVKDDLVEVFVGSFFGDGTGDDGNEMLGAQAVIADDPTAGIVGGIDRSDADNEFWRNQYKDASGAAMSRALLRYVYNRCTKGASKVTLISTDLPGYEKFEDLVTTQNTINTQQNAQFAKLDFDHFVYKNAVVVWDEANPDNSAYFLNKEAIKLVIDPNLEFESLPWVMSEGGVTKTRVVLLVCQLVPVEPRRLGVLFNMSN